MWIFIILLLCFVVFFLYKKHLKINLFSFFRKGFKCDNSRAGCYIFNGKQGYGKTYGVVNFLLENKNISIYSNVRLNGINHTYFEGFDTLIKLGQTKKDCIIFYDEIFTALNKSSKMTNEFMSFVSQLRKRNIYFITTAQEWLEINLTLRRYCRYSIQCRKINFFGIPIFIQSIGDAYNMIYDKETGEYTCPIVATKIMKGNKKVVKAYDTYEIINSN